MCTKIGGWGGVYIYIAPRGGDFCPHPPTSPRSCKGACKRCTRFARPPARRAGSCGAGGGVGAAAPDDCLDFGRHREPHLARKRMVEHPARVRRRRTAQGMQSARRARAAGGDRSSPSLRAWMPTPTRRAPPRAAATSRSGSCSPSCPVAWGMKGCAGKGVCTASTADFCFYKQQKRMHT